MCRYLKGKFTVKEIHAEISAEKLISNKKAKFL